MRWQGERQSDNVDDRRGRRASGGGGFRIGGGGLVLLLIAWMLGADPRLILSLLAEAPTEQAPTRSAPGARPDDGAAQFASVILASTEDVWTATFAQSGRRYQAPKLVLFDDAVSSACGREQAATGPFYCPADQTVYLDLSFFNQLSRMGGAGDFAAAYVIGHEVGHHVQNLLGTSRQVSDAQRRAGAAEANQLSVALELQADCYAGVWAKTANQQRNWMDEGDVGEGLAAAAAIGDDTLMRNAGRRVTPDAFTHGSSAQRTQWLKRGMQSGEMDACNTFR